MFFFSDVPKNGQNLKYDRNKKRKRTEFFAKNISKKNYRQ